jgi:hypothetical protein
LIAVALVRLKTTGEGLVGRGTARVPTVRRFVQTGQRTTLPQVPHITRTVELVRATGLRLAKFARSFRPMR